MPWFNMPGVRTCGTGAVVGCGIAEAVGVAESSADAPVVAGRLLGVGVVSEGRGSVPTLAPVVLRPALSMANHAVADSPATAVRQIAAMPTAERGLITTMWPLCHHAATAQIRNVTRGAIPRSSV
jgi:hypothetical protein